MLEVSTMSTMSTTFWPPPILCRPPPGRVVGWVKHNQCWNRLVVQRHRDPVLISVQTARSRISERVWDVVGGSRKSWTLWTQQPPPGYPSYTLTSTKKKTECMAARRCGFLGVGVSSDCSRGVVAAGHLC